MQVMIPDIPIEERFKKKFKLDFKKRSCRLLSTVWASSDLAAKRILQRTLFPDGIFYS